MSRPANLFSASTVAQAPLISFKAGKLMSTPIAGTNKLAMKADPRKGLIVVVKGRDGKLHLQWRDRTRNGAIENDFRVTPDCATFTKIDSGRVADRCYRLKFKDASAPLYFFWMQDALASNDAVNAQKVADALKTPSSLLPDSGGGGGLHPAMIAQMGLNPGVVSQLAANPGMLAQMGIDPAMAAQLLGGQSSGASTDANTAFADLGDHGVTGSTSFQAVPQTTDSGDVGMGGGMDDEEAMLQAAIQASLAGFDDAPAPAPSSAPVPAPAPAGGVTAADLDAAMAAILAGGRAPVQPPTVVPLNLVADADRVTPHLDAEARSRLASLLPEGQRSEAFIDEILRSPQLQQALGSLTSALQSDNFETVFANFNLQPADGVEAINVGDVVRAFLLAIQAQVDREATGRK